MTGTPPRPRVLVVDDHAIFRSGVRAELEGLVQVVGEAGTVADALELALTTRPDVVLLDVHMPDGGGLAVLHGIASELPATRFLALSVSDSPEDVIELVRAGARGYVTKTVTPSELADAIVRVAAGRRSSRRAWPGSYSTPSRALPARQPPATPSWTNSRHENKRCWSTSRAATSTKRSPSNSACRPAPWRATYPRCCANSASPTATS